jgi:hypothetical protein
MKAKANILPVRLYLNFCEIIPLCQGAVMTLRDMIGTLELGRGSASGTSATFNEFGLMSALEPFQT